MLFPGLGDDGPQALLDGSARRALEIEPPFDRYIFIDSSEARCKQLELLKHEFPNHSDATEVRTGDANHEIRDLCKRDWRSNRAVLFLDPYGMQVEWETIVAIARTNAIDLWMLFPLGVAVNRLLTRSGEIPPGWRNRLNILLGTEQWYDEFYNLERTPSLFGDDQEHLVKATTKTIGRYFSNRLDSIFAGVAERPGVLRNSTNNPLYLLCFAVANQAGRDTALRVANHLLKRIR